MNKRTHRCGWALLLLIAASVFARPCAAYSLLTHEQLIDLTWSDSIVPLLLSRYPNLTAAQLDQARAYAYGGCVIQDIGYYPFGDQSFSNLTHYVRSGDFVVSLFRNATNANELAFAVGALSHYVGDSVGHSQATNLAVPIEFPKLRARYGSAVNYAEGEHQHVQTEFAFDIDQVAHHRLAPLGYLRHIGLQVPLRQLALAFYQTYGLTEDFSARRGRRFNVRAYRFATRAFIPRIAYALTLLHRSHEPADADTTEFKQIEARIAAASTADQWDRWRHRPGLGTYALAGLIFITPKIGPLALAGIKGPTAATEADYVHSVAASIAALHGALVLFTPPAGASQAAASMAPSPGSLPAHDQRHPLLNRDLDTGVPVRPGGYPLTDSTYAALLHALAQKPAQPIPPGIKQSIQAYYANPDAPIATKKNPAAWARVQADLAILATIPTSTEPAPYPTYGDDAEAAE